MIYIGWILVIYGLFLIVSGVVGLYRFKGFYGKIHAASLIDSSGALVCLIGTCFLQNDLVNIFKILIIIFLILLLSPVASGALARSALSEKVDKNGRIK